MASETVVKRGWLTKQGNYVKSWKLRWFILREKSLSYYKSDKESDATPAGTIALQDAKTADAFAKTGKKHCFELQTPQRTFYLYAETAADAAEWMSAISKLVVASAASPAAAAAAAAARPTLEAPKVAVTVRGIHCEHCCSELRRTLSVLPGVLGVEVSLESDTVIMFGTPKLEDAKEKLEQSGFLCA